MISLVACGSTSTWKQENITKDHVQQHTNTDVTNAENNKISYGKVDKVVGNEIS